ncbi:hypothetical protein OCK74_03500 [Chitinophagaceae bacterium LB-8]|uniref:Alpha-galactosidase n=1 Tax=Paraflavisolibacter caeni TaxID=2982496 RepID=A0A9X2XSW9_9BACT|nr:hypothetical protein [Paraflavisolibacter caeni]MCU7548160.1 hypothetical protein [Paraflavisolibacter caeni]
MSKPPVRYWTLLIFSIFLFIKSDAQELVLKNDRISRTLKFNGRVWLTTQFADAGKKNVLSVKSEELHMLFMDNQSVTLNDYILQGKPGQMQKGDSSWLIVSYQKENGRQYPADAPGQIHIKYSIRQGEPFVRKVVSLDFDKNATIDRLETERFVIEGNASGGGRGEPVFVNEKWFFGLEYPAGYSRHTDGNTPKDYSRYYEKVGNYSYIDLEGKDIEPKGEKGMLRLMHFPGYAVETTPGKYQVLSKTATCGISLPGQSVQQAFMNYLSTIWKAPRSFLHYNNWFEPMAKDLSGDGLLNIWRSFKTAIAPYGVKMDAMVVDDGWQDRKSIWEPLPKYFPNGFDDVRKMSDKLKAEGVGFGMWLSLNGYTNNIDWGIQQGYKEAKRNSYFSQYGRYYSLSAARYKNKMLQQLPDITKKTGVIYYKHDFNDLSDAGEGNGHPPTERHGHEANLDAAIQMLLATRKINPEIHQNLTNWIWFSPYWLMYADYLWMLAGDDGTNKNWPEISTRAMASTDRDTYIYRMFGNPADRPLVPISRLMTHGIIKTSDGRMESPQDNLQDWLEYVIMHYGRGTLLKEWYISPSVMSDDYWKALCTTNNWAAKHRGALNNTVYCGGRPDEGNTYGYIGWDGNKAVLVARNPQAVAQKLIVPFNESVQFYGNKNEQYRARVVFPYQDVYPKTFVAGKAMEIVLPGYATMVFEFEKGKALSGVRPLQPVQFSTNKKDMSTTLQVPANAQSRCDLLLIGRPVTPSVKINGLSAPIMRSSKSKINDYASYAVSGMPSAKAKDWSMISIDLRSYAGKTIKIEYSEAVNFECFLLTEQKVTAPAAKTGNDILWPITNQTRRQTVQLF